MVQQIKVTAVKPDNKVQSLGPENQLLLVTL